MNLALDLKRRILFLVFVFIICYFVFGVVSSLVINRFGIMSTPAMRILSVFQDIFLFIMPAIITALFITREPANLLALNKPASLTPLLWGLCVMMVSIPAMDVVIWLNQQLPLPESLRAIMQEMESNAQTMVQTLQGPHTMPNLLLSILIVGIFAGFSEELIFRGALQRIMVTGGMRAHAAIWITAIVFSLLHMQIYGFVPRMLLGAFFGYALWWTGSLWVPVILHVFNNTVYLISDYLCTGLNEAQPIASWSDFALVIVSLGLTICCLWIMKSTSSRTKKPSLI